ncbi:hypothetical protein C8R44DRAFT_894544 [Mycena epipterygia]|nr:hypothetical protein C8R44DRAFT_894544 [Mycena epipterygia]
MSSPSSSVDAGSDGEAPQAYNPFIFHDGKHPEPKASPFWSALSHSGGCQLVWVIIPAIWPNTILNEDTCKSALKEGLADFATFPVLPSKTPCFRTGVMPAKTATLNSCQQVDNVPHLTTVYWTKQKPAVIKRKHSASVISSSGEASEAAGPSSKTVVKKEGKGINTFFPSSPFSNSRPFSPQKPKRSVSLEDGHEDGDSNDGLPNNAGSASIRTTRQSAGGQKSSSAAKGKANEKKNEDLEILVALITTACEQILGSKHKLFVCPELIHHLSLPNITVTLSAVPGTCTTGSHHAPIMG